MAVPPLAEIPRSVQFVMVPPSAPTGPPHGVANADGAASVAAAVDVADCDRAAIGGSGSNAAVTSRSDI